MLMEVSFWLALLYGTDSRGYLQWVRNYQAQGCRVYMAYYVACPGMTENEWTVQVPAGAVPLPPVSAPGGTDAMYGRRAR